MPKRLTLSLVLFLLGFGCAQGVIPASVVVLKEYGFAQTGAATLTPSVGTLGIEVYLNSGAASGVTFYGATYSLPLTLAETSDGVALWSGVATFQTAAAMNSALTDGTYDVLAFPPGTSPTSPITSGQLVATVTIVTGQLGAPVTITNYAALQDWTAGTTVVPTWGAVPNASSSNDYILLQSYGPSGNVLASDDPATDTSFGPLSVSGTLAGLPTNTQITGELTYAHVANYIQNGGYDLVSVGVGFTVGFSILLPAPPVISTQPAGVSVIAGGAINLSVQASASGTLTYQWEKGGTPIAGATSATFTISSAAVTDAGSYTVVVTGPGGSTTSSAATVAVAPYNPGRITNLSISTIAGAGDQTLAAGFVIAAGANGSSAMQAVLVRGIGPTLGSFGVPNPLTDPVLSLYPLGGSTLIASNNGWGGSAQIAGIMSAVGAFSLPSSSLDSVIYSPALAPGGYSAQVNGQGGTTGAALAEVYDATPAGTYTKSSPRLSNVSGRAQVTPGSPLAGGFTVGGTSNLTVLIRASGPALFPFGITDFLPAPTLQVFPIGSSTPIASNTGWGGISPVTAAASAVGAFAWTDSGSADSALVLTLAPGSYSAVVTGAGGAGGVALLEIYEVPQ